MGCTPEQTRINAQKSTGPKTARGKAIASRNRRTHGLLSKEPPLLESEDLSTFQGLLQQLVDHYQPDGPIEWHLIQQIAMGMLKQWRVWNAEAVVGNKQVAGTTLRTQYPAVDDAKSYRALARLSLGGTDDRAATNPEILREERSLLTAVIDHFELCWDGCPKSNRVSAWEKWLVATAPDDDDAQTNYDFILTTVSPELTACLENYPNAARPEPNTQGQHCLYSVLCLRAYYETAPYPGADGWVAQVIQLKKMSDINLADLKARVSQIDSALTQIEALTQQTKHEHALPESLQLIARYETHINRQLTQALDKLRELQAERLQGDTISPNGKN